MKNDRCCVIVLFLSLRTGEPLSLVKRILNSNDFKQPKCFVVIKNQVNEDQLQPPPKETLLPLFRALGATPNQVKVIGEQQ